MTRIGDIASVIERTAPLQLQEHYDNSGLQIGSLQDEVTSVLVCLTVTESVVSEAVEKGCNLIVSHHPLLFRGLKHIGTATAQERIVTSAIRNNIAIYSAHTNLDSASDGVNHDIALSLGMKDVRPLSPTSPGADTGLGIIGMMPSPVPALEFLHQLKKMFDVKVLRYSSATAKIVIRRVAICGGSGSGLIGDAIRQGADAYVSGDLGYHDFDSCGPEILLADIGHYESEYGVRKLLRRIIQDVYPNLVVLTAESETNPINNL